MQAFTSLLCIGLISNSLGLPRPQWLASFGNNSIIQEPGNVIDKVFINPKETTAKLTTVASGSLESNDILEVRNLGGENSGIKQLPQLKAETMKQDISKNELIEKVENITIQLGTLMKNESQIIVSELKDTLTNIAKNLKTLATKAEAEQSTKQIGEHVKAMSDGVSNTLGQLGSAVEHELINKLGPEVMLRIVSKIGEIETTMGNIVNDVEIIAEKKHIRENIEKEISKVINELGEIVGKDSVHTIQTIAHVVSEGVGEAVEGVEKLITDDNEDNKANNGPTEN